MEAEQCDLPTISLRPPRRAVEAFPAGDTTKLARARAWCPVSVRPKPDEFRPAAGPVPPRRGDGAGPGRSVCYSARSIVAVGSRRARRAGTSAATFASTTRPTAIKRMEPRNDRIGERADPVHERPEQPRAEHEADRQSDPTARPQAVSLVRCTPSDPPSVRAETLEDREVGTPVADRDNEHVQHRRQHARRASGAASTDGTPRTRSTLATAPDILRPACELTRRAIAAAFPRRRPHGDRRRIRARSALHPPEARGRNDTAQPHTVVAADAGRSRVRRPGTRPVRSFRRAAGDPDAAPDACPRSRPARSRRARPASDRSAPAAQAAPALDADDFEVRGRVDQPGRPFRHDHPRHVGHRRIRARSCAELCSAPSSPIMKS